MKCYDVSALRRLVFVSMLLAFIVIALGSYTRLTHAGLGCPDWPGCYGHIDVPQTSSEIFKAEQAFPERPVEPEKAWNEMIHRYFAGALGLCVFGIFILSCKYQYLHVPIKLPILLLLLVTFQAALGMWTVTLKLMPVIVMGHLLGGFTTLCLLFLLYLRLTPYRIPSGDMAVMKYGKYALLGIVILTVQIALGGWTSANYAALVCTELPLCQAGWIEQINIKHAFDLIPPARDSYEFGHLEHDARVTIHVAHRIGAIVTTLYLLWLAGAIYKRAQSSFLKQMSLRIFIVLACQVSLGISNVWLSLPIGVAVSHNLVAVLLMLVLITLTYSLKRKL